MCVHYILLIIWKCVVFSDTLYFLLQFGSSAMSRRTAVVQTSRAPLHNNTCCVCKCLVMPAHQTIYMWSKSLLLWKTGCCRHRHMERLFWGSVGKQMNPHLDALIYLWFTIDLEIFTLDTVFSERQKLKTSKYFNKMSVKHFWCNLIFIIGPGQWKLNNANIYRMKFIQAKISRPMVSEIKWNIRRCMSQTVSSCKTSQKTAIKMYINKSKKNQLSIKKYNHPRKKSINSYWLRLIFKN